MEFPRRRMERTYSTALGCGKKTSLSKTSGASGCSEAMRISRRLWTSYCAGAVFPDFCGATLRHVASRSSSERKTGVALVPRRGTCVSYGIHVFARGGLEEKGEKK